VPLLVDPALPQGTLCGATQPRLTTNDGLVLRPWQQDDAAAVLTAFACPEIQQWHVRRLDTPEEAAEWIEQWARRWKTETAASWAVVDDAGSGHDTVDLNGVDRNGVAGDGVGRNGLGRNGVDGEGFDADATVDGRDRLLGQIGLRNISLAEGSASLSYWVTPAARGRSIAARSVEALSAWAFESIGFNRLSIQHSTANAASCRVAERTGHRVEGTLRQAIKHADGWHDWHLHGRLRTDV
jgi:RimJ/RimL family protein N-acetyltransferase